MGRNNDDGSVVRTVVRGGGLFLFLVGGWVGSGEIMGIISCVFGDGL